MEKHEIILIAIWLVFSISFLVWKYKKDGTIEFTDVIVCLLSGPFLLVGLLPFGGWGAGDGC